jgi:predicted secreted protein
MLNQIILFLSLIAPPQDSNIPVIRLKEGQKHEIQLKDNSGSTGYVWSFTVDTLTAQVRKGKIVKINPLMTISAYMQTYVITGKKKGKTQLEFLLKRPWEKDAIPMETKRYEIIVE